MPLPSGPASSRPVQEAMLEALNAGPGGSGAQVFEVAGLDVPAGTDWSLDGHVLGELEVPRGVAVVMSFYIEIDAPLADGDDIYVGEWPTPGQARGTNDWVAGLSTSEAPAIVSKAIAISTLPNIEGAVVAINSFPRVKATPEVASVQQVGIFNGGPSVNPIHIVHARAAFLVI